VAFLFNGVDQVTDVSRLSPRNLSAQLSYRGRGNPPVTHPTSAISNCFPGLEFDFRAIWRRIFVGIVLTESNNYVVEIEDHAFSDLKHTRLLRIDGHPVAVETSGPIFPGRIDTLSTAGNPDAVSFLEWSNTIALLFQKQGEKVACEFTAEPRTTEVLPGNPKVKTKTVDLEVRRIFDHVEIDGQLVNLPVLAEPLAQPGELSQGLCSPWQNDYRECACYYWAASRPDYVNVVAADDGTSRGENWMQRQNTGSYLPDNRDGKLTLSYDDLFVGWEKVLKFVIGGIKEK
jgi:hypothetical protein